MDHQSRRIVREGILDAVDAQIRDGDPPATRQALERLVSDGYSTKDARTLIAKTLAAEMFEIVKHHRPHDPDKYARALRDLPREEVYGTEAGAEL